MQITATDPKQDSNRAATVAIMTKANFPMKISYREKVAITAALTELVCKYRSDWESGRFAKIDPEWTAFNLDGKVWHLCADVVSPNNADIDDWCFCAELFVETPDLMRRVKNIEVGVPMTLAAAKKVLASIKDSDGYAGSEMDKLTAFANMYARGGK